MADVMNEVMTNDKTNILSGKFLNFYTPRKQRIRSLKVYFSPKQAGEGTPSIDNVRPISGWTGVEANHCGKNLFDESQPLLAGWINADGTYGGISGKTNKHTYKIPVKPGITYTYSASIVCSTSRSGFWYDKNNSVISYFTLLANKKSVTATAPENAVSVSLTIYNVNNQKIQFEVGDSATDYTPYKAGGNVPTQYQEVEYIQGNVNSRIDTNIKGDDDSLIISGKMLTSVLGQYQTFFGNYIDENHMVTRLLFGTKDNGNIICDVNRKAANSTTVSMDFTVGEPHEFVLAKSTITVDGTLYNYSGTSAGTLNDTSIAFNASRVNVEAVESSNYRRWYYFKIQNSQGTILNYIPCYRKSDNVAGMWDTVSEQFYPSIGSEQFVAGPEVNPYSVDWSDEVGTVYGGYVDLISGELTETWKCIEVNSLYMLGGTSYGVYKLGNYEYAYVNYDEAPPLCNILSLSDNIASKITPGEFLVLRSNAYHDSRVAFRFKDTPVTAADYRAKIQELSDNGTPLTVAFKITTPVIHQLSSTALSTLMFDNNFWSNADRIEIEYDYIRIFDAIESRKNIFTATPHLETLSGMNMTFNTDMERELKKCIINFSPIQLGTGDPSPENIRNIYGRSEIGIGLSNENLLPKDPPTSKIYTRTTGGGVWASASRAKVCAIIPLPYGSTIFFQKNSTGHSGTINLGRHTVINVGDRYYQSSGFTNDIDFAKAAVDALEYYVNFYSSTIGAFNATWTDYEFMISYGTTRKTYIPPMGTILNVDFPEEIYGGYVDVLTGELWRTWKYIPLSNLTWYYNKSWGRFESAYITSATRAVYGQQNVYCDIYKAFPNTTGEDFQALGNYAITFNSSSPSNPYLIINDSRYTTKDDFVANLTGNIAYKLKTPQLVTTLDPQVIRTLQGVNNIWSNANGNLEIAYWKHGDDAYQHIPTSNAITTISNNLIVTEDGYVIGEEDDFIVY